MTENLVELLTRYVARPWHDPLENRLTAGLAAAAQNSNELAGRLLAQWGLGDCDVRRTVRLQRPVGRPNGVPIGYVDLEVTAGSPESPSARVWVEAKLGSRLSGADQLTKYVKGIHGVPGEK